MGQETLPVVGVTMSRRRFSVASELSAPLDTFVRRHVGSTEPEVSAMLQTVGVQSLEDLSSHVIPPNIRYNDAFELRGSNERVRGESDVLHELRQISLRNKVSLSLSLSLSLSQSLSGGNPLLSGRSIYREKRSCH